MSARTGLGPIETGLLATYGTVGARAENSYLRNSRILGALESSHQIAPLFGYRALCDLARPYVSHLRLVDFHGNYGSPDFSEASAKYTESRLALLGNAALDAEDGSRPPLPIGMINGTAHHDGRSPPLSPENLVAALLAANDGAGDSELIRLVGQPQFPTGCVVLGDLDRFALGEPTELRLETKIEVLADNTLQLSCLPPRSSLSEIGAALQRVADRPGIGAELPIVDVEDPSLPGESRLVVRLQDGAIAEKVASSIAKIWGVHRPVTVQLADGLPTLLRGWIADHGTADLAIQLEPIRTPQQPFGKGM